MLFEKLLNLDVSVSVAMFDALQLFSQYNLLTIELFVFCDQAIFVPMLAVLDFAAIFLHDTQHLLVLHIELLTETC